MLGSDSPSSEGSTDHNVNRRTVLQGLGTGVAASVGLVGTASAHEVEGKPVFCGCSELCVCVDGNSDVLVAQADPDGGFDIGFITDSGELDPYPQGTPRYSGDFCVDTAELDLEHGRIIGLQVEGTRWVNPNSCAQEALEAEQRQLDSTHPRPKGASGQQCEVPPCEGSNEERADIDVTWEDCETVHVTGTDDGLDEIIVHPMRCFPDGPCPDGVPGGRSIKDPELPLTIDHRHLAIDDDVPYAIYVIELRGDVIDAPGDNLQDVYKRPDDLDCSFELLSAVDVTFEDCETVTLTGEDDTLEKIDVRLIRCFDDDSSHKTALDGTTGCPTGHIVTREGPDLPLTLGRDELAVGGEQYFIDRVDLFGTGEVPAGTVEPPQDLDCQFDPIHGGLNIEFEMDEQTITLGADEDAVSQVTITGAAEFGWAGWGDSGIHHAFITSWAQSGADIEFPDMDIQRYFDIDSDTDVVNKDIEITFDVPPEVGDPEPGESIETEITGVGFFGLEREPPENGQSNIGDWRDNDPMTLTIERESESSALRTWSL